MRVAIGIDIGASYTRLGIVDSQGNVHAFQKVRTPRSGDEYTIASFLIPHIRKLLDTAGNAKGIGIGTIGPLDIRKGIVVNTPNNPIKTFHLKEPLEKELGLEIWVVNDCVAAVWGEYLTGAGKGYGNIVYVTLSTGIGGGAVINHTLILGKNGNASEIGHLVVDYKSSILCGCGGKGHWEGLASGNNVWKLVNELAGRWRGSGTQFYKYSQQTRVGYEDILREWRRGDLFAEFVAEETAKIHAAGLASVIHFYDPEIVTLGGSIIINNPDYLQVILKKLKHFSMGELPEIKPTPLGDMAVMIGAALIALNPPSTLRALRENEM